VAEFGFSDVLINFIYDIRLPQGFTPESSTKKLPTKRILKTIDSGVKPWEVEYHK